MCFPSTAFLRCLNGILTLLKFLHRLPAIFTTLKWHSYKATLFIMDLLLY